MYINNKKIDTKHIETLIKEEKIISAIKYVRGIANIGLKDSKNIIDNLIENSNFYDNEEIHIIEREEVIENLDKNQKRKGSHFIKRENKTYLFLLFIVLLTLFYWFFIKYNKN